MLGKMQQNIDTFIEGKRQSLPKDIFEYWLISEIESQSNFIMWSEKCPDDDDPIAIEYARAIKKACVMALIELRQP